MPTEMDDDFNKIADSLRRVEDYIGQLENARREFAKAKLPVLRQFVTSKILNVYSAGKWVRVDCTECGVTGSPAEAIHHRENCMVAVVLGYLDELDVD